MKPLQKNDCCFRWMFLLIIGICASCHSPKNADPLFSLLPASVTNITFNNVVTNSNDFNIFRYRNFYNGGGVAIGDLNNDGRPDIFFTSNQQDNRLYFNRGDWKFEDVSRKAGITGKHRWHTGVTMVDINADGWLDIYVCNSGSLAGDDRSNELYINNHDGTFTEKAAEYGLDDKGLGTHAAFFDYDHDGDLDCFILNNSFRSIESFGNDRNLRNIRSERGGDRLYRNDQGHFHDVSAEAGIYGSEIGFGLGITVGDLNNDGWCDIYVSNDFFEKDYLYINQRNGSFKEVIDNSMGHTSAASMGSDMADINNDGLLDIFTTDMLPESDYRLKTTTTFENYDVYNAKLKNDFHHQFTSNCLQLNNGDGTFSEIAALGGLEATDWSWGALSFDFDNDGWKDIFVCNGISKDLTDQDFLAFFGSDEQKQFVLKDGFNFKRFLDKMPATALRNYGFLNQHNLRFRNASGELGFTEPSFSNGAAYADLDGDGDLDLVVNNENQEAFVFRNMSSEKTHNGYLQIRLNGTAPNTFGYGARVTIYTNGMQQVAEQMPGRGFESSVDPVLHFGTGPYHTIDSLVVRWPDNAMQILRNVRGDTVLTLKQEQAHDHFIYTSPKIHSLYTNDTRARIHGNDAHKENAYVDFNRESLIPKMLSTEGPKLAVADVNGDGLSDFFMGSAIGDTARIFVQKKNGSFAEQPQAAFAKDKDCEDVGAVFFDADGDGDQDLVVVSGGNQYAQGSLNLLPRLYLNNGSGIYTRSIEHWPAISINASCVRATDVDGNGTIDLFIGGRSIMGSYGKSPGSYLLLNDGKGNFTDRTADLAPGLKQLGMVTDARWSDLNDDGKKELIVAGDWMPVTVFGWKAGRLEKKFEIPHSSGWWNCLIVADINGDGRPDLIAGNMGLNAKIRADRDHPATLYVDDFDGNGRSDCIACYYKSDGKSYPFNLKDDLIRQLPGLKKKFLHYSDYAGKAITELLSSQKLDQALKLTVEQTQTCIFYNEGGDNHFSMAPLPVKAQLTPVYGILATDLDGDGKQDIFMAGNFFGLKPEAGRYDAGYGTALLQGRNGNWRYLSPAESGLFTPGEVRDIQVIRVAGTPSVLVARNNDSLLLFKK